MTKVIKLNIIENNALIRKVLTDYFKNISDINILGRWQSVQLATSKVYQEKPDVIIYGCENINSKNILKLINFFKGANIPILFFLMESEHLHFSVAKIMLDNEWGILPKPSTNLVNKTTRLLPLIETKVRELTYLSKINLHRFNKSKHFQCSENLREVEPTERELVKFKRSDQTCSLTRLIAIGASTGGTEALSKILPRLPTSIPGIVIVIHMPERFTKGFAARLNSLSKIKVVEARNPTLIECGKAIIASGGFHLKIEKKGSSFMAIPCGKDRFNGHCPSVDVLFTSVATVVGQGSVGVILTGMGKDGAEGLKKIKNHGGLSLAQDESTSIVFGMPKKAIEIGGVQEVLPLQDIAERLIREFANL